MNDGRSWLCGQKGIFPCCVSKLNRTWFEALDDLHKKILSHSVKILLGPAVCPRFRVLDCFLISCGMNQRLPSLMTRISGECWERSLRRILLKIFASEFYALHYHAELHLQCESRCSRRWWHVQKFNYDHFSRCCTMRTMYTCMTPDVFNV